MLRSSHTNFHLRRFTYLIASWNMAHMLFFPIRMPLSLRTVGTRAGYPPYPLLLQPVLALVARRCRSRVWRRTDHRYSGGGCRRDSCRDGGLGCRGRLEHLPLARVVGVLLDVLADCELRGRLLSYHLDVAEACRDFEVLFGEHPQKTINPKKKDNNSPGIFCTVGIACMFGT